MKKMSALMLCILLLCCAVGVHAEESADFTFNITLVGRENAGNDCIFQSIYRMDITRGENQEPFQTLYFTREGWYDGDNADGGAVQLQDINFDGYPDLDILYFLGATNSGHTFFLYDPLTGQFTWDNGIYAWLSTYALYPDKQVILNHLHNSALENIEQVFHWQDGQLQLIREAEVIRDEDDPDQVLLILREPNPDWGGRQETYRHAYSLDDAISDGAIYAEQEALLWQGL